MELHAHLVREVGLTQEQAEGTVGALLRLAHARLPDREFRLVADSIPVISDLMGKSPRFDLPQHQPVKAKLSSLFGGLGKLAPLAEPLARLQIDKKLITRSAEALQMHFASKISGEVSVLLAKVWS